MAGIPVQLFSGSIPIIATELGQLIVAPIAYDNVKAVELDVDDTAFNFYKPLPSQQFVITGIYLEARSNVQATASVHVYEGTTADDTIVNKSIFLVEILKNADRQLSPLNILVTEGRWVNCKSDDSTVAVSITGYYIPVVQEKGN
jgi:hypothetical protein